MSRKCSTAELSAPYSLSPAAKGEGREWAGYRQSPRPAQWRIRVAPSRPRPSLWITISTLRGPPRPPISKPSWRWSEARLRGLCRPLEPRRARAMLASSRHAYFLGVDGAGAAVAFAILRDLDEPHGNLYLKRIAVDEPGQGVGGAFLGAAGRLGVCEHAARTGSVSTALPKCARAARLREARLHPRRRAARGLSRAGRPAAGSDADGAHAAEWLARRARRLVAPDDRRCAASSAPARLRPCRWLRFAGSRAAA